jgi:hypothetical protein
MKTQIDIVRDEVIQAITDEFGFRVGDITFTELSSAVLFGFDSGAKTSDLKLPFRIGEAAWYIKGNQLRTGTVTSYTIYHVNSADHREVYKRVKYTITPHKKHLATFISKGDCSDIFHTENEALLWLQEQANPTQPD